MEDYKQRRQREAAQTEQAILKAAMQLCRRKAFDKVSVREICSLAGITTGAFYHHFPSKEALLAKGFSSLDGYVKQALAGHEGLPPEQRLAIILTSYADFMEGLGWELAARYYQQRLGNCAASTLDPQRFLPVPERGWPHRAAARRAAAGMDCRLRVPPLPRRGH